MFLVSMTKKRAALSVWHFKHYLYHLTHWSEPLEALSGNSQELAFLLLIQEHQVGTTPVRFYFLRLEEVLSTILNQGYPSHVKVGGLAYDIQKT